ncbi:NADH-quinone oxidoreductase subunit C [Streptomyces sp. Je 1-79]|uniref:NADH-quinone oxidoreductase subunit C n=1 Tax=Streptomyces sp. Je 1-79 TaxID=2943847 RepID=UPI0021A746BE|nr:NADH-quinone oxidoreductase subunit C [Streptomyces sp. Je 1-79]MCT4355903.1 NADH-quinone oxidoreductase subunit C [Streptomyces sp. Je 1-79]
MNANAYDSLPEAVTEVFGEEARAERAYDLLTVDVPVGSWIAALEIARDKLGCTYFDWLSAVDEPGAGFRVCAHVVALEGGAVRRLLVRTTVSHEAPVLPTAIPVYAGAEWHERETHEMFGVEFTDHPNLVPLLLPENFEGHPLRKDFVLAARVVKAWPGAKEPGESEHGGPKRRQMLPPGVPDPNDWGPMKGQLPPAPARPARAAATGDRPARRTRTEAEPPRRAARTAPEDSTSQPPQPPTDQASPNAIPSTDQAAPGAIAPADRATPEAAARQAGSPAETVDGAPDQAPQAPARPPRRSRSAADGSASQAAPPADGAADATAPAGQAPTPTETTDGAANQAPEAPADQAAPQAPARPPRRSRSAADGSASQAGTPAAPAPPRTRSSDAPWHHARPTFDETPAPETAPEPAPAPEPEPAPEAGPAPAPKAAPEGGPQAPPAGRPERTQPTDPDAPTDPDGGESA